MARMLKNREGGILVTKEIITDENLSEVTLFPMWKKKNHHHQNIGKEENRSLHFLCFRYDFILKKSCTECKKNYQSKNGLNQLLHICYMQIIRN